MKPRHTLLLTLALVGCGDSSHLVEGTVTSTTSGDISVANEACRAYDGAQSVSPKRIHGFWRRDRPRPPACALSQRRVMRRQRTSDLRAMLHDLFPPTAQGAPMYTVPALSDAQSVFDFVVRNLRDQGGPSTLADVANCAYRGSNDRKCAAGFLINDEEYDRDMEGQNLSEDWLDRFNFSPDHPLRTHIELVRTLQQRHDDMALEFREARDAFENPESLKEQLELLWEEVLPYRLIKSACVLGLKPDVVTKISWTYKSD
jgi:hypothetical protein